MSNDYIFVIWIFPNDHRFWSWKWDFVMHWNCITMSFTCYIVISIYLKRSIYFFFVSRRKKTSNRDISLSEHMHTIFHISKMPLLMFAHSFGASIYFVPYISASCSKGYWFFFHSQFQWSFERYTIPSKWPESIGLTGGESNSLEF